MNLKAAVVLAGTMNFAFGYITVPGESEGALEPVARGTLLGWASLVLPQLPPDDVIGRT